MRDPLVDLTRKSTGEMGAHVLASDNQFTRRIVGFGVHRGADSEGQPFGASEFTGRIVVVRV